LQPRFLHHWKVEDKLRRGGVVESAMVSQAHKSRIDDFARAMTGWQ